MRRGLSSNGMDRQFLPAAPAPSPSTMSIPLDKVTKITYFKELEIGQGRQ